MNSHSVPIAIAWQGLPAYAVRALNVTLKRCCAPVKLIATRPSVPIQGLEELYEGEIRWIDGGRVYSWEELGLEIPDVFFQTGWSVTAFNRLGKKVRAQGGSVVAMVDNNFRVTLRRIVGAVRYRFLMKHKFDAVLVPGRSGRKLMETYGVEPWRIYEGLYGADPSVFYSNRPLHSRDKRITFVGKLNRRKGVDSLLNSAEEFTSLYPDWEVAVAGTGTYEERARQDPDVNYLGFLQPEEVASLFRRSRFCVLPSRWEHWGVVVHEATLSGCGLVLSRYVGALSDLANDANAEIVKEVTADRLTEKFTKVAEYEEERLMRVQRSSMRQAERFGPEVFCSAIQDIVCLA